jgi:hypothetical protein
LDLRPLGPANELENPALLSSGFEQSLSGTNDGNQELDKNDLTLLSSQLGGTTGNTSLADKSKILLQRYREAKQAQNLTSTQ